MSVKRQLPLVSILIPNFNHSRYLDQCIQSAINQTYPNKEIVLLDNSSTDDSVKVAENYIKDGVIVCRNQFNIRENNYKLLAKHYGRGKYFVLLCADDYLLPDFIECAVAILEMYPSVGYVHGERDIVTSDNKIIEQDPFYKYSFVASGKETMPIYLAETVAYSTQGVIRKEAFEQIGGYNMEIDYGNVDRSLWFYLSYEYDMAYIRDKMCRVRLREETASPQGDFRRVVLSHLTMKDYLNFARRHDLGHVYAREEEAFRRLAKEYIGYAGDMLLIGDFEKARDYLDYAFVVSRDVEQEELYRKYRQMILEKSVDKEFIKRQEKISCQRKGNCEPPKGYEKINPGDMLKWQK